MNEPINAQKRLTRRERAAQERRKVCRLLSGMLALGILLAAVGLLAGKDRTFSENENRMLTQKPEFGWAAVKDGSLFRSLESYLADQFPGRDSWISLHLQEKRLLRQKESNGVYLGRHHYLMEIPEEPDEKAVQRNQKALRGFGERYPELKINMMVVPNAVTILEDYLPRNAPVRDQMEDIKALKKALPENVQFISVTKALKAHREEEIFYHTDHHWTSQGAYYAFQSAAKYLGIEEELKGYQAHTVSTTFEGTMASQSGCHEVLDTIEVYEPKDVDTKYLVTYEDTRKKSCSLFVKDCLEEKDQYTVFFGGNHPRITIRTTNDNGRRLLIFKDSYANCFVQFLAPYYEKIVLVDPRYYYDNAGTLISTEQITDVLFLYNLNTYLGDTALGDTLDTAQPPSEESADPAETTG